MIDRLMRATQFAFLATLVAAAHAQNFWLTEAIQNPKRLQFSPDASQLQYQVGDRWWTISTTEHNPRPVAIRPPAPATDAAPQGEQEFRIAQERPYGPRLLLCACASDIKGKPRAISPMPVSEFVWARDSASLWVIGRDGADQPIGKLSVTGSFEPLTREPAARRNLVSANGHLAWVQSDGTNPAAIWLARPNGEAHILSDMNPRMSRRSGNWKQEVVRWRNGHGEALQGVLVRPRNGSRHPLIVDPYSNWVNRFLNIPVLGNYQFVEAGYAVFFPDHRAPHTFPEMAFGEPYVGASKTRDPVDVLTDDVMTGVQDLVRNGIARPDQLFLYSSSNGASAILQLLTQTGAFRAAVAHGGVANWLDYYHTRQPLGDGTIPGFLGGRRPEDSPGLYERISPALNAAKIRTPLLLMMGDRDTRYQDALEFKEALLKTGNRAELIVYSGQAHEVPGGKPAEQHLRKAMEFFQTFRTQPGK